MTRNGAGRDQFARKHDILCFEKEATGLRDSAQYLVIRGISDYADLHSSDIWHAWAAATAAAYVREVFPFIRARRLQDDTFGRKRVCRGRARP